MKKLLNLILALVLVSGLTLTAFADGPDVSPNIPRSPSKPATTTPAPEKELETGMEVPKNVVPNKTYTAVVGKTYKLPDAVKLNCDTFFTSDSKILTVNMETGGFKAVANGTAYIVVVNTTARRYIKVTVGTGKPATNTGTTTRTKTGTTTATSGKGALAGYSVTVTNKTTLAVKFYIQTTNGVSYAYFATADNTKLGSMTEKDFKTIMDAGLKNGTISYDGDERSLWFANQFNIYRGLTGSATTEDVKINTSFYFSELADLINNKRSSQGIPLLNYDANSQELADERAREISTKFSHTRPDGSIVTELGYAEICTAVGNKPAAAFNAFSNSNAHNTIMLDESYTSYTVACYEAPNGNLYWVVLLTW